MASKAVLALVGCLLPCCGGDSNVLAGSSALTPPGLFDPRLEPGRVLLNYAWEDSGRIPWMSEHPPEHLAHGELGRTADTGLYLTFSAGLSRELAGQPEDWRVEATGLEPCEGRFGGGVRLTEGSLLRAVLPSDSAPRIWTLEFWILSAEPAGHDLFSIPEVVSVYCNSKGRLELKMPGAGSSDEAGPKDLYTGNPTPLVAGVWHHVGIVLDLEDARGVRLVVDGEPYGVRLDPARVGSALRELRLGDVWGRGKGMACILDEVRFSSRNSSTEELGEHWRLARRPFERLRLSYLDGEEELLVVRDPRTEPVLDSPEAWALGELEHAFVAPAGLMWSSEHWRRVECSTRPMARTTHALAPIGERRLLVFGGETRDTHWGLGPNTNDTWIFDAERGDWSRVSSPSAPSARCHMPAAFSPDHGIVLLAGGWWQGGWWQGAGPEAQYDDTWVFHVAEGRWEQRSPSGYVLPQSTDHGLLYLPESRRFLFLKPKFAAYYDPQADRWEEEPPMKRVGKSDEGASVHSYMSALDPESGRVFLFGGQRGAGFSDRSAWFDPRTNELTVLDPPVRPAARVRGALAYDPRRKRFVLFGGVLGQRSQRFDDLWTFDPARERWSEVPRAAERPTQRGGFYGMVYDEAADAFVLPFGRSAYEHWQDETLLLELDETRIGRARYVFDRAAFPGQQLWFADFEAPGDSAVGFRYRSSEDGLRFGGWSEACPETGRFVLVEVVLTPGSKGESPVVRGMGFRSSP